MPRRKSSYTTHLSTDPILAPLLERHGPILLPKRQNVCLRLCASIMGQQLSTKVAKVIFERFLKLYDGNEPTPQDMLATPVESLRSIGLSGAKAAYVHNVATYFLEHNITDAALEKMSDEEVVEKLTPIKGVGRWTVEMLLMFTLGREDVFAPDDLGIQQAMIGLYGLDTSSKKAMITEMRRIAEAWKPYRTYACLHLWRWKDGDGAVAL